MIANTIARAINPIPQAVCFEAIIKKATNTETAEADNPPILKLIFITSKSNERARDFISFAFLKNYTTLTDENENLTHEVAVAPLVPSLRSGRQTQIYKKTPLFFFEEVGVFPNSLSANFCKSLIQQNFSFALQSRVNPHAGFEVLPLTLQSEIKGHRIISLIKGNLKN
jgi:hypothetical protein